MKSSVTKFLLTFSMIAFIWSCDKFEPTEPLTSSNNSDFVEDQYIVVLNSFQKGDVIQSSIDAKSKVKLFLQEYGISDNDVLAIYDKVLIGFCAKIDKDVLNLIKNDKRVEYVEQDKWLHLDPIEVIAEEKMTQDRVLVQTTPWGITAIGGAGDASSISRVAWILDTGIDLTHSDLNVNSQRSRSFVTSGQDRNTANDLHGHGTHVAGIVGAKNNTIGVVGVAAGCTLIAIKVLNRNGSGTISQIVNGLNHVANNGNSGDVVNLSLGGGASTTLDNAVTNCASYGLFISIAAGNSSANAGNYSPARVNGTRIFTISAHDVNDRFASFSNYGNPPIDYCAPGVSVYSTYKSGGYATMSGTSMSAPHAAGILLMNNGTIYSRGTVSNDRDNNADALASRVQ